MIKLTEDMRRVGGVALGGIWIGDSTDEASVHLDSVDIGAILNVAQDMVTTRDWSQGVESMHVGLIDGPGNEVAAYCSAVLALHALLKRHNTLVCCHVGGRALAVAIMYLNAAEGAPYKAWDHWLAMLGERVDQELPTPNDVHRNRYVSVDWHSLTTIMKGTS